MKIEQKTPIICSECHTENNSNLKYCFSCGYELPNNDIENKDNKPESEQEFIYTNINFTLSLLGICFGLLILMIVVLTNLIDIIEITIALSFTIPIIVFFLFKKKIKRLGKGEIKNGVLHLELDSKKTTIELNEIEHYKIEHYNGTTFKLKLKSGKKYKIIANNNFCDATSLEAFTDYFGSTVSDYKNENNEEIVRKKSIYEYKWMFYFLIVMTITIGLVMFYALYYTDKTPGTLFTSLGIVFIMWAAYYKARKKNKK